jgi:hypothetical protein
MKNKIIILLIAFCAMSCNKFLDVMPDKRAALDSEAKIERLMRNAYSESNYAWVAEMTSDNVDRSAPFAIDEPSYDFQSELFYWRESMATNNESPAFFWDACYTAIYTANTALAAIEDLGGATTPRLRALKGEALVVRAYSHFILVNLFSQHYSKKHSYGAGGDLGVPYILEAETQLNPQYTRPNVAYVYEMIDRDLQEGLPLINDAFYDVPAYRFNTRAAHTFASRFYLFYEKWDRAEYHATRALGVNPLEFLRDYEDLDAVPQDSEARGRHYARSFHKCNFLLQTTYSNLGRVYGMGGRWGSFNRGISHTEAIAYFETNRATAPWGPHIRVAESGTLPRHTTLKMDSWFYIGTMNRISPGTISAEFQWMDPIAGTGFLRAVIVLIKAEEALLNRAEARVMQNKFDEALEDINIWVKNSVRPPDERPQTHVIKTALTIDDLIDWENGMAYYTPLQPTAKKRLDPDFAITPEQTTFLHTILFMRRIEFLGEGRRLFDVKRYGIEIERRNILGTGTNPGVDANGQANTLPTAGLITQMAPRLVAEKRSQRLVIQLPAAVIAAGLTPNPSFAPMPVNFHGNLAPEHFKTTD